MRQQTITPSKKLSELLKAIEPYIELWDEWTSSGATFLSKKQIVVIETYLLTGSHILVGEIIGLSPVTSAHILNRSMQRLIWNYKLFQDWQTDRLLEQHSIITYSSDMDRFLNAPYQYLPISSQLKMKLRFLEGETLKEILSNFTEEKMSRWPLHPKIMKEFKEELSKMNCLHLLTKNPSNEKRKHT